MFVWKIEYMGYYQTTWGFTASLVMHSFNVGVLYCQDTVTWLTVCQHKVCSFLLPLCDLSCKETLVLTQGGIQILSDLICLGEKNESHMSCSLDAGLQTFRLRFFLSSVEHQARIPTFLDGTNPKG